MAIKLSGRTFLAPHRGSSPKGEGATQRYCMKVLDIDNIGLFNIARYTVSMPLLPSALPPKGEARRYVANDFLNLIALLTGGKRKIPFIVTEDTFSRLISVLLRPLPVTPQ